MKLSYTILILFLLVPACGFSQPGKVPQYFIRNYNDENGLPQNSMKQVVADSSGFIWLATESGLLRFDGRNFKVYNRANTGIQSDRFVYFTNTNVDHRLYGIAEFGKTVLIQNGKVVPDTSQNFFSLNLANVKALKNTISRLPTDQEVLSRDNKHCWIVPAASDSYYLYYDHQIMFCEFGQVKSVTPLPGMMSFDLPSSQWNGKKPVFLKKQEMNTSNFFTVDKELIYHFSNLGNKFLKIGSASGVKPVEASLYGDIETNASYKTNLKNIRIIWNPVNGQAFAYLDRNFYLISYENDRLLTRLILTDFDFDQNYIKTAFYRKSDGCIFLGSAAKGLFLLTPKSFQTLSVPEGSGDNIFYAQTAYDRSTVLTPQGYIIGPDKPFDKISQIPDDNLTNKYTLLRDRSRFLWIVRKNTIFKLDPNGRKLLGSWEMEDQPVKIYQGAGNTIWAGLRNGRLFALSFASDGSISMKKAADIPETEITWLLQDTPGKIWVGTVKGLFLLDIQSGKLEGIKGMAGINIRCLYSDQASKGDHPLWITTYGNGMFLLDKKGLTRLPSDQNKYLDYAHCIIEDQAGHFWISTNKGLFQASKQDLLLFSQGKLKDVFYFYYNKNDGFLTNEFNGGCQPCGTKLDEGYMSFPSLSGLVWFKPSLIQNASLSHSFLLEDLSVDGEEIPLKDTLLLPYNFKYLSLSVATPFFTTENNLRFRYSIRRAGDEKTSAFLSDKNQVISIYNLSAGNYVLTIQKVTGFGNQHVEKRIYIQVAQPWFLSWWFITLSILFLIGIVLVIVRQWTQHLTAQNRILGQKVMERTQELSATLNDLKKSEQNLNKQLQILSTIIGVISHDIRSPLRHLTSAVKKLYRQVEITVPHSPHLVMGKSIYESADKVFTLTDDLLKFIKVMRKRGQISYEQFHIGEIFEAKRDLFAEMASESETKILVTLPDDLILYTNRQMLDIMIHNLVDNAVKYTFKDTITLSASKFAATGITRITVCDTGDGMPSEIAEWLSDQPKNNGNDIDSGLSNTGLGLIVFKEIAAMLDITIKAETAQTGTSVHLYIKS